MLQAQGVTLVGVCGPMELTLWLGLLVLVTRVVELAAGPPAAVLIDGFAQYAVEGVAHAPLASLTLQVPVRYLFQFHCIVCVCGVW